MEEEEKVILKIPYDKESIDLVWPMSLVEMPVMIHTEK